MLNFGLNDTAEMIRSTVQQFCKDKIYPIAAEVDVKNAFPNELWPQFGALGLLGITVEEEFGGAGLGYL
jgi:isovaleryl-CoA dehydrogenase